MKKRESKFELVRIIAMFLIVVHHVCVHTSLSVSTLSFDSNVFILQYMGAFGKVGVALFMILSGYFLVTSNAPIRKIKGVLFPILFYSLFFVLCLFLTDEIQASVLVKKSVKAVIKLGPYWFMICYIALYLLLPYINKLLITLGKRDYKRLLVILILVFSVLSLWIPALKFKFAAIIVPYIIGGYLRRFPISLKRRNILISLLGTIVIFMLSIYVMQRQPEGSFLRAELKTPMFLALDNSPIVLAISVLIFLFFQGLREFRQGTSMWFNRIASCMLGVYLIHDNQYVRKKLLGEVLQYKHLHSSYVIVEVIFYAIAIFIASILIEGLRQFLTQQAKRGMRLLTKEKEFGGDYE